MVASLAGVRHKLQRAEKHLADLNAAIQRWGAAEQKTHPFVLDHQPQRKRMVIRHGKFAPDDPDWALIVGDIIHTLRSALDHIVCQLAILNGNDVSCCEATYFPICICKPEFKKAEKRLKHLISAAAFARIEGLQPYHATDEGKRPASAFLWAIHHLDIIDKHRILLIVGKKFRTIDLRYSVNEGPFISVGVDQSWRPMEDGTEVASIDMTPLAAGAKPEDKMRMQGGGTEAQVFIDETGCGCDGIEVVSAMSACIDRVSEIIEIFASEFFSS